MTGQDWKTFVLAYGWQARADHLAWILQQPARAMNAFRGRHPCASGPRRGFAELFALWHGRPPADDEWPRPRRFHARAQYEWQAPELALLARLVGTMSVSEIATTLTRRLRQTTGDPTAVRNDNAVQVQMNRIGLQSTDVVGGLTIKEAAAKAAAERVGSLAVIYGAVNSGALPTFRVGRLRVIPHAAFETWLAGRDRAPEGWVRLASLSKPLGIRSDSKLPEYASLGYVPDVVFVKSSNLWFIKPETAQRIVDDAHEGRPLPWHGAPLPSNLWWAWQKWQRRRHRRCAVCAEIWGKRGAPSTFLDFCERYASLDLGLKRHLTRKASTIVVGKPKRAWGLCRVFRANGITIAEAARALQKPVAWVRAHIRLGVVRPLRAAGDPGAALRISPAGMRKLRAVVTVELRDRPHGVWLGLHAAAVHAGVSITTIQHWGRARVVQTKPGPRGLLYSKSTLERQARTYWPRAMKRYRRAAPPAWLQSEQRDGAAA